MSTGLDLLTISTSLRTKTSKFVGLLTTIIHATVIIHHLVGSLHFSRVLPGRERLTDCTLPPTGTEIWSSEKRGSDGARLTNTSMPCNHVVVSA